MNKKDTLRKINEFFHMADKLAIELIESEARKVLNSHLYLKEFVMGMGTCCFSDFNENLFSNNYNELDPDRYKDLCDFFEMVYQLNEDCNVMGYPMRFTANGPKITNW